MVNATAFPDPYAWQNIANESSFQLLNASRTAWEMSAGSIAWDVAGAFIILLVPIAIWTRSQNAVAAAFGQLTITLFMHYYGLVPGYIWTGSYVLIILMIAFSMVQYIRKRDD